MTLGDVLEKLDRNFSGIMYRTKVELPDEGVTDILAGWCEYKHFPFPKLIPKDGDNYSFDDEICDYVIDDDTLVVWYESE